MKKYTLILVLVLFATALFCGPSYAQFTSDELLQREYWEDYLNSAKILSSRQLSSKRGITQPYVLVLEKDGIIQKAIWKPIEGLHKGFAENWRWEIAAYRLDKYLGLNMIPPTVERKHLQKRGSIQLWRKRKKAGLKISVFIYIYYTFSEFIECLNDLPISHHRFFFIKIYCAEKMAEFMDQRLSHNRSCINPSKKDKTIQIGCNTQKIIL